MANHHDTSNGHQLHAVRVTDEMNKAKKVFLWLENAYFGL